MTPSVRSRFLRNVGYFALANEVEMRIDPRPGDPWPCHWAFFGASLALTARAYRAVGGLPALSSGEDAALERALRRAEIPVRIAGCPRPYIRPDGRSHAGRILAALLASWSTQLVDEPFKQVPSGAAIVARASWRRRLREHWQRTQIDQADGDPDMAQLARFIRPGRAVASYAPASGAIVWQSVRRR